MAAVQEMSPTVLGARIPFLLAAALFAAIRAEPLRAGLVVLLAAFFTDALAAFPTLCSPLFFFAAGLVARRLSRHSAVWSTAGAAFLAEIWYAFWGLYPADEPVFLRALAAIPLGACAAGLIILLVPVLERAAGIGGSDRKEVA